MIHEPPRLVVRALVALVPLGCSTAPPEFVGSTEGTTSEGLTDSTAADPSGSTEPPPGTTDTGVDDTSPTATSTTDTSSDTGPIPTCGDGIADAGEECDAADLAGGACDTFDFDGGTLACNEDCTVDLSGCGFAPMMPTLSLAFSPIKQFDFTWAAVADADAYQLLESPAPGDPYVQLGDDVMTESISIPMPLHLRYEASYVLRACNAFGCTDSDPVDAMGSLAEAVGYVKASNTGQDDMFGFAVAISGDGNTLAVGAPGEDSSATGINGAQAAGADQSGAVYVLVRDPVTNTWSQQAYVKASNTGQGDGFGVSVALSDDGSTLVVGADFEDSSAIGIGGSQGNGSNESGAAYVFVRDGATGAWSQQAYVKASNTGAGDRFGWSVALSGDGDTLAVGAWQEDGNATGIGGNGADNSVSNSGAAYVFVRNAADMWSQQAYVKASNTDQDDTFGWSVALSGDGNTLAVGADLEDSGAAGIGGDQADDTVGNAGAVYVLTRDGAGAWAQQAYIKASNPDPDDGFGYDVALSADGSTLVVGAPGEDSSASGIDGDQANAAAANAGAVYVLVRDGGGGWSQQAYVKASNTDQDDYFGAVVALSDDGTTLAAGAWQERSSAIGLQGDEGDDSTQNAGACYVLVRDGAGEWSQQAYVKAPNTGADDTFAGDIALASNAGTLAVGAEGEDGSATGLGGDQASSGAANSGAAYLY